MLKHAADLSASHEYFIVWVGETNARPWGSKADAYTLFPEFEHAADGVDLTGVVVPSSSTAGTTKSFNVTPSTAIEANEFANATLRLGTKIAPLAGYGVIQSHAAIAASTAGSLTVTWTIGATAAPSGVAGYIVRENRKWGSYPQVRVLTPYQPVVDSATDTDIAYPTAGAAFASSGKSITLPAPYSGTTGAASFEDVGVFLPFSFFEGIDGWGISESNDSAGTTDHGITGISGTTWTYANAVGTADHLNGGYVLVDWETGGVTKRSWAPITDSTTTTFVVGTWLGDGDPTAHGNVKRYTAWIPHYNDSPHAYLPGEGFTYPNNDMQPCAASAIGAAVHNRPRNITGNAYGDKFGDMLVAASRLSSSTGKRVNVVHLGVNDSSLVPSNARNASGFPGALGWWDFENHGTWAPNNPDSIYQRLDKLLRTVLPNALLAEASTKSLRCLGIVFSQGETDALSTSSRQHYSKTQKGFITALRNLIDTLGFTPYANGAKIPYVQPRIAYLPYALDATYDNHSERGGGTVAYNADTESLVNTAIEENTSADGFAASVKVDDLPRLTADPGIYSGIGEAELGSRIGDKLSILVDYGLAHGSTALANAQTKLVGICNLALSNIGDSGQITSLDDGSEQAALCKKFLPEARDGLLQMRQWSFALRRRQLVGIQRPEAALFQHWTNCYVMPAEAMSAFTVLPPVVGPSSDSFDHTEVTTAAYGVTFAANDGSATETNTEGVEVDAALISPGPGGESGVVMEAASLLPIQSHIALEPQAYAVEQSPLGHRYIFTNQTYATLQYVARVVDADQYSPQFATALACYLGSMLASVTIKGDEGEAVSGRLLQKTAGFVRAASASDARQQRPIDSSRPFGFVPDHLAHR